MVDEAMLDFVHGLASVALAADLLLLQDEDRVLVMVMAAATTPPDAVHILTHEEEDEDRTDGEEMELFDTQSHDEDGDDGIHLMA